jgi:hypothetical protein
MATLKSAAMAGPDELHLAPLLHESKRRTRFGETLTSALAASVRRHKVPVGCAQLASLLQLALRQSIISAHHVLDFLFGAIPNGRVIQGGFINDTVPESRLCGRSMLVRFFHGLCPDFANPGGTHW